MEQLKTSGTDRTLKKVEHKKFALYAVFANLEKFFISVDTCYPNDAEPFLTVYQKYLVNSAAYCMHCYHDSLQCRSGIHRRSLHYNESTNKWKHKTAYYLVRVNRKKAETWKVIFQNWVLNIILLVDYWCITILMYHMLFISEFEKSLQLNKWIID